MAMIVEVVREGRYMIELDYPELAWLKSVSEKCRLDDSVALATVVSHGLATMVILTKDLQREIAEDEQGGVNP